MSKYLIRDATLKNLADEIRRETGKSEPLLGASMTDELRTFSDSLTERIVIQDTDLDSLEAELSSLEEKEDLTEEIALQDADLLYLESEFDNLEEKEDLIEEIIDQKTELANLEAELDGLEEDIVPEGTLEITENGTYDVAYKASVEVNVAGSGLLTASTEEEMDALFVEDNLGQVVKYVGEDSSSSSNALIEAGEDIETLYFNTSIEPDLSALTYDSRGQAVLIGQDASSHTLMVMDFGVASSGQMQGIALGHPTAGYLYCTEDLSTLGIAKGWQNLTDGTLYVGVTVSGVHQQDLWSSYISKEPFIDSKYETNSLYLISEAVNEPIAVDDTINGLYFNTSVEPDFSQLLLTDSEGEGLAATLITGSSGLQVHVWESTQGYYELYVGDVTLYGKDGWTSDATDRGGACLFGIDVTVYSVNQQDLWSNYISKEPFGSNIAASELNVTSGSLAIVENGTYDVTNKESVSVNTPVPEGSLVITENGTFDVSYKANVKVSVENRGMFTPNTEDEMEALLATGAVGQAVKYIGDNVYVDGVPFQVGDKITRVYFNPSVEIPISFFESLFTNFGSSESISLFWDQWQNSILNAYSLPGHGDNGEHVYCLVGFGKTPLYSTARMGGGVYPTNKGWCGAIGGDNNSNVNLSEGYVDITGDVKITEITAPADLFKYISKESMLKFKYEKDALYLIIKEDDGTISTRRLNIIN